MGRKARRQIKHIREDEKRKNKNLLGLVGSLWGYDHAAAPHEGGRNGGLHVCGRRWWARQARRACFVGVTGGLSLAGVVVERESQASSAT